MRSTPPKPAAPPLIPLLSPLRSIAKTLNECLAKLSEHTGSSDIPAEARADRAVRQRRSSKTLSRPARGMSSFVFATIEEHGEMTVGDEEDEDSSPYKGVHSHARTPSLRSRESSRDNLKDMVEEGP